LRNCPGVAGVVGATGPAGVAAGVGYLTVGLKPTTGPLVGTGSGVYLPVNGLYAIFTP